MAIVKDIPQDAIINSAVSFLKLHFPAQLKSIVLFGSRARNDYSIESDYDFIAVFNARITAEMKDIIRNFVIDNLLENGVVLNIVALSNDELEEMRFEPFIMNAFKEGVLLE